VPCIQGRRTPEVRVDRLALVDHLILFEQLGEQDVQRADEHDQQDEEGDLRHDTAFAQRRDETIGVLALFLDAHRRGHEAHPDIVGTSRSSGVRNQIEHFDIPSQKI
jgi:hypothetical protein